MDELIEAIEKLAKGIESFFSSLLNGILDFLNFLYNWLVRFTNRVASYLTKFFIAMAKLFVAVGKLSLFFIPGIISILLGIFLNELWSVVVGCIWLILLILIGLAYKRKQESGSQN